ncbi:D-alanyl-D-alanine carboxypeptidase [Streptomyces sp. NPDC013178]|uniref:D-alanyl-D-alanine carboxypeptidase n=1 Tax=unclassified Streptomyces TaxID=2593676 RepID=UPI0033E5198A
MAGESPDRSKQRESSAEPTPGSAGAVPEARDPRVAQTRGGVDTATRVFSVRQLKTDGSTEDSAEPAGGEEPEEAAQDAAERGEASGSAESPGKRVGTSESRDERLRAAVAQWVASADEKATGETGEDSGEGPGKGSGKSRGSKGESARDEAEDTGDSPADATEPEGGREPAAKTDAKREPKSAKTTPKWATSTSTDAEDEPGGDDTATEDARGDDAEPGEADARGRGEQAPRSRESEDEAADGAAPADTDGRGADAAPAVALDRTGSAAEDDKADESDKSGKGDAPGDGDTATKSEAPEKAGSAGDVRPSGTAVAADAGDEPKADTTATADKTGSTDKTDEAGRTATADEGDEPKADKTGADDKTDEAGRTATADEGDEPKADGAGADDSGAEADPDDKPGTAGAPAESAVSDVPSDTPVDQPTAVFKAPRPTKPAVDQPTTMLKLGGAAKAGDKDKKDAEGEKPQTDAKAQPGDKPSDATTQLGGKARPGAKAQPDVKPQPDGKGEAEDDKAEPAAAERTSKFVALKPLDDPSTRQPKPPVEPAKPVAPADSTAVIPQIGPERTTQQPLPPKPPLDLLAELTNTPPPPPTPLRTLARRVKIWTPLVVLLAVVFAIVQAMRPLPATALTLTAKDSYTFEGGKLSLPWPDEGQGWMDVDGVGAMGSFGKQTPVAIGSVAKTMTAYIVLKDHPLKTGEEGPSITVDATAEKEGGYNLAGESTLDTVKAGDKLTLKQALSAVMIPSANNIARLLARWDAGSEAAFIEKMNATAKQLGMTNTTYTDPSGLKETTVSTAEDQVKLGNAVVKIPALVAITSAASWTDPSGRYYSNYNELPYLMGAIGIKTGSTTKAGGNLLFAARKEVGGETVTVVGAVLGQHKPGILKTVNTVSRTALTAAESELTSAKIVKKGDVVGYVDDGLGGRTPVVVTKDVTAVGWAGLTVKLSFAAGEVPHTAKAGTQVGTLTVGDGSGSAVKVPVALQDELVEPGFMDKLTRVG